MTAVVGWLFMLALSLVQAFVFKSQGESGLVVVTLIVSAMCAFKWFFAMYRFTRRGPRA